MKTSRLFLLLPLLWLTQSLPAQVQWYQNQDGNSPPPGGTFGSCSKPFTTNSFVACYQWGSENELYSWKITKSHINGTEQRCFFLSGTWANVEMRTAKNTLYVLLRSFPLDGSTSFTVYKLDTNLVVQKQKQISFPNQFLIYNINAFELDHSANLYLTGDGQFPIGADIIPASFIIKTDKNLLTKWYRMDTTATSYTQVQLDRNGRAYVIEDYYTFFPEVKIRKFSSSGALLGVQSLVTDPGRFNLISKIDDDGHLYLYGGQTIGDTAQAMYLYKLSRYSGNTLYFKNYFQTTGLQIHDFVMDKDGGIFTLASKYELSGEQRSVVARIKPQTGNLLWTREYSFSADSLLLSKLVVGSSNRFYVVGNRRNSNYLSKGVALRFNRNGQPDAGYNGPDSIDAQRSHALIDGLIDRNDQLITIGNTNDFDPFTYNSTYFRAFAVRFGSSGNHGCDKNSAPEASPLTSRGAAAEETEEQAGMGKLMIYPNPAVHELVISNVDLKVYDQLYVYNLQGGLLFRKNITGINSRIDVHNLAGGTYILVLRGASLPVREKTFQFTVQR